MQLTEVRVDDLVLDPKNARTHDKRNIETISNSLAQFGQVENIVVQAGSNKVIGGNGRVQAMRDAGIKTVQANVIQMNDAQAAKLALALNRTAQLADWDRSQLAETASWLEELGVTLDDVGFGEFELADLTSDADLDSLDDAVDSLPEGDQMGMQTMVFSLTKDQKESVERALQKAKNMGEFVDTGNTKMTANCLARMAEVFCGLR